MASHAAWSTIGNPGRCSTRSVTCWPSGSLASPAAIPTPMMPTGWPTTSRFENGVASQALYARGRELAARVVERHRQRLHGRARRITIDLDPTDDPTHGAQQLTFFNGHYDGW